MRTPAPLTLAIIAVLVFAPAASTALAAEPREDDSAFVPDFLENWWKKKKDRVVETLSDKAAEAATDRVDDVLAPVLEAADQTAELLGTIQADTEALEASALEAAELLGTIQGDAEALEASALEAAEGLEKLNAALAASEEREREMAKQLQAVEQQNAALADGLATADAKAEQASEEAQKTRDLLSRSERLWERVAAVEDRLDRLVASARNLVTSLRDYFRTATPTFLFSVLLGLVFLGVHRLRLRAHLDDGDAATPASEPAPGPASGAGPAGSQSSGGAHQPITGPQSAAKVSVDRGEQLSIEQRALILRRPAGHDFRVEARGLLEKLIFWSWSRALFTAARDSSEIVFRLPSHCVAELRCSGARWIVRAKSPLYRTPSLVPRFCRPRGHQAYFLTLRAVAYGGRGVIGIHDPLGCQLVTRTEEDEPTVLCQSDLIAWEDGLGIRPAADVSNALRAATEVPSVTLTGAGSYVVRTGLGPGLAAVKEGSSEQRGRRQSIVLVCLDKLIPIIPIPTHVPKYFPLP